MKYNDYIKLTLDEQNEVQKLQYSEQTASALYSFFLDSARKHLASNEENAREQADKALKEANKIFSETMDILDAIDKIYATAEQRYIDSLAGNEQAILEDIKKILQASTKEDFETIQAAKAAARAKWEVENAINPEAGKENIDNLLYECSYVPYLFHLHWRARVQLNALSFYNIDSTNAIKLIDEVAEATYKPTEADLQFLKRDKENKIQSIEEDLEKHFTHRSESFISINDTASNRLFNPDSQNYALSMFGENNNGQICFTDVEIYTGKKGKQKVNSLLSVWYGEDSNVTFTKNNKAVVLTDYDRAVFNAIITLYKSNTKVFTLPMLYGTITGKEASYVTLTENMKKDLIQALQKLRNTEVSLNFENESASYTFEDEQGNKFTLHKFKETIINIGEAMFSINGQKVAGYVINSKPKLLTYAENKKQLITTPNKALELGISLKNTPEVIAIRQFLIDEIGRICSPNKQSNHITYDAIYKRAEYVKQTELTKKQKQSTRQSVLAILDSFKLAGYVSSFKEVKKGNTYHHIEIIPAKKDNA